MITKIADGDHGSPFTGRVIDFIILLFFHIVGLRGSNE